MISLSAIYVAKDTVFTGTPPAVIRFRIQCNSGDPPDGIPGLTPSIKITKPDGTNLTMTEGVAGNWRYAELNSANIEGDYEISIKYRNNLDSRGIYTLFVDSGHPGVGEETFKVPIDNVYGQVVADAGNNTTQFKTDLPFTQDDVLNHIWVNFLSDNLVPYAVQVKKTGGYNGTTKIVFPKDIMPATPADDSVFFVINK
jgi:hypothetical protein